ncbi:MAG: phage terminase large subunit, partial [Pyrinomonadaceae bacterium]|nr:phage terminase large subunit [Pyrinomonadaceae bacterium]
FDDNGVLYIDGGFRARIEYPDQRRYILERLEAEPNVLHGVETALHGMAFIQDIRTDPRARGRQLKGVKVGTDKVTRALTWSPLAEEGKVVLVRGAWNEELIEEASSFPAGRHDDQVDAISLAVQLLAELKRQEQKQIKHISAGF